jgi:tetratricopeptide (TPR) repeat protein
MIDDVWDTYRSEEFPEAMRLASHRLVDHAGIDLIHIAGLSLMQMHRYEEGIILLRAAAVLRPNASYIYTNAAFMVEQLGLPDDLEFFTSRGLRDFPDDPMLRRQHANIPLLRQDYRSAIVAYQGLLASDPDDDRAHLNLATTYRVLGDLTQSEKHFDKAVALESNATFCIGRAALYGDQGRIEDAIAILEGVKDWDAKFMLALSLLSIGDYKRGFELHRDRWYSIQFNRNTIPPRPFDRLEQIIGKPVVVLREGGFGDVFQFMRYLPKLAKYTGQHVLFHALPSEMRLLRANLPPEVRLQSVVDVSTIAVSLSYEHTTALLDLPYLFGTTVETIPAPIPYIHVPDDAIAAQRLPPSQLKRVGLAWAGGGTTGVNQRAYDGHRSIKLCELSSLADVADIEFINLQFGQHAEDHGMSLTRVLTANGDWLDTAAIVAQLDLVISVDTAIVHLSAAMGRPTWLLSRFNPCWRWLRNRPTSLWYPGVVRVFGQTVYGDWSATIADLRRELEIWSKVA